MSGHVIIGLVLLLAFSATMPISGLSVTGSLLEMNVSPGEHIRHNMVVSLGEGEQSSNATAKLFGYAAIRNGASALIGKEVDKNKYSASGYFEISPETFSLEPGMPANIILEGDVPDNVKSGGRYAIVEIKTLPIGNGSVGYSTAVNVPILLTINGADLVETGKIEKIEVTKDGVLSITLDNNGNHHYGASVEVLLKDKSGNIIKKASSERDTTFPGVPFQITIPLNPEKKLAPGTYAANISMIRKDGTVLDTDEMNIDI